MSFFHVINKFQFFCKGKGQIKSEWIYEIIDFPKNDPKNLKDFCPMNYKNSQGRKPYDSLAPIL